MDPTTGDNPTGFWGEESSKKHESTARGKGKGRATHKKSNEGSRRNCD